MREVTETLIQGSNLNVYEASFIISKMSGHSERICDDVLKCFFVLFFSKLLRYNKVYISRFFTIRLIKAKNGDIMLRIKKKGAFRRMLKAINEEDLTSLEGARQLASFVMKPVRVKEFDFEPLIEHLENRLRHPVYKTRIRKKIDILEGIDRELIERSLGMRT